MAPALPVDGDPTAAPAAARAWTAPVAVGVGALAGCVASALFEPSDNGPVLCPFRALTGLDCPGCGMTRAVGRLATGRVATAADYNLVLVVALPVVAYLYLRWLAGTVGVTLPAPRIGRTGRAAVLAAVVIFSVARNLPVGIGRYLNSDPALR